MKTDYATQDFLKNRYRKSTDRFTAPLMVIVLLMIAFAMIGVAEGWWFK